MANVAMTLVYSCAESGNCKETLFHLTNLINESLVIRNSQTSTQHHIARDSLLQFP